MDRLDRRDRGRRSNGRDVAPTRSAYIQAQGSRWEMALLWASLTLFTACLIGVALSLRIAGALLGVSPAAAAELSEPFAGLPSTQLPSLQLSQSYANAGSDDLAAALLMPDVNTGPLIWFAAADGSNAGPSNVPGMQLASAALSGGISTMINYPFGFWCSDNFRVLAGMEATNLNRLCGGLQPSGAGVVVREEVRGDETPPLPPPTPFDSCESIEVLAQQTAEVTFGKSRIQITGPRENVLNGNAGGFGFNAFTIQQNNGVNTTQQGTNTVGGAFGSFTF